MALRTALVNMLDRGIARSRCVSHALAALPRDIDPIVYVGVVRVQAFRRAWHATPELREVLQDVWHLVFETEQGAA
eukprot:6784433-Alexandrium_andersonii.AAC.1